jgi:hypothetical protein
MKDNVCASIFPDNVWEVVRAHSEISSKNFVSQHIIFRHCPVFPYTEEHLYFPASLSP